MYSLYMYDALFFLTWMASPLLLWSTFYKYFLIGNDVVPVISTAEDMFLGTVPSTSLLIKDVLRLLC